MAPACYGLLISSPSYAHGNLRKLNAAFALTGVANTLLGPMTPLLESRWHIGDAEAGLLFTALFLTSVWGAIAVGPLARRFGYHGAAIGGLFLTAAGMAGCAVASWPSGLISVAAYGLGLGFAIPAGNLAAGGESDAFRAVVWLNWSWCIGAVAAPALTEWFGMNAWWIGAAGLALCAGAMAFEAAPGVVAADADPTPPGSSLSRAAILTGVFLFIYVATEQAIGGWVAALVWRSRAAAQFWAAAPSIFWAGLLTGRTIAPLFLKRSSPGSLMYAGLIVAAGGSLALLFSQSAVLTLGAAAISGVGLAPIYPLAVAQYATSDRGGRASSGLVFAAGGLGGAAGPLATGYVSQVTGDLRLGLAFALPAIATMALLQRRIKREA